MISKYALDRAMQAGINPRRPYKIDRLPSGAVRFVQEASPPSDRPESEGRFLHVVIPGWAIEGEVP